MEKQPHILVIGAGLIGLSTADSLLAYGARVTIADKNSGPGQGASYCNSGMIHPSQAQPWRKGSDPEAAMKVTKLAIRSRDLLTQRMKDLRLPCANRAPGTVQLFENLDSVKAVQDRSERLGIACENITGAPFTYGRFALRFPDDASGNAYEYCAALTRSIEMRGGRTIYNVTQQALERLAAAAEYIVIAAGAQSAKVAKLWGIELPVQPVTGFALNYKRPKLDVPDVPLQHHASHSALTVFDNHVRLSGTVGETTPDALEEIWGEIAFDMMLALGQPVSSWSGDRPMCEYGRPIIAHSGSENIWINTGHGHMGWTLSAGSGDLMARMIVDGSVRGGFSF